MFPRKKFQRNFNRIPQLNRIATPPPVNANVRRDTPFDASSKAFSQKLSPSRSKKRKLIDQMPDESFYIDPPDETLSAGERSLRIAEASVLFPEYMASYNAKRVKLQHTDTKRQQSSTAERQLLFLPSTEYTSTWHSYYHCSPTIDEKSRVKALRYFDLDCRNPGTPIAKNAPNEKEMDPLYYDLELNQRIAPLGPELIVPPEKGSLDNQWIFSSKGVVNSADRVIMDSFVLALRREMGDDYFDINALRYYPRSNARRESFYDEKSRRMKSMKNSVLDVDVFLRNRQIERQIEKIRQIYLNKQCDWTDKVEEEWDRRIVQFVNPYIACKGRTFYSMQDDLGIEDDRYSPPQVLHEETFGLPVGTNLDGLGTTVVWSAKANRMVSVDELRRERNDIQKLETGDQTPVEFEGIKTRSRSRSPSNRIRNKDVE